MNDKIIVMDTDVVTSLCKALEGNYDPNLMDKIFTKQVHEEIKAIFRIFIYMNKSLRITPTVKQQIMWENQKYLQLVLIQEIPKHNLDDKTVDVLANKFLNEHKEPADCRILAEAEYFGSDYLLTRDNNFRKKLQGKSSVSIFTPSGFWSEFAPSKGACKPQIIPSNNNPKIKNDWWLWK